MFASKKWIAPVAALALLAGVTQLVRAANAPTTEPTGKATVTVTVLGEDSKPVEGANVYIAAVMKRNKPAAMAADNTPDPSAKPRHAKAIASGKTDKDGTVTLAGIPDGTFNVVASTSDMTGRKRVTIADEKDAKVTVTLKPKQNKAAAPAAPTN